MAQIDALRFGESWQLANLGPATLRDSIFAIKLTLILLVVKLILYHDHTGMCIFMIDISHHMDG